MTSFHLTEYIVLALQAGAWLAVGMLLGAFHFLTLRWNIGMLAIGRARLLPIAVQLGRFAFLGGVLAVVAGHFGALPLLLAACGILAGRTAILRWGVAP